MLVKLRCPGACLAGPEAHLDLFRAAFFLSQRRQRMASQRFFISANPWAAVLQKILRHAKAGISQRTRCLRWLRKNAARNRSRCASGHLWCLISHIAAEKAGNLFRRQPCPLRHHFSGNFPPGCHSCGWKLEAVKGDAGDPPAYYVQVITGFTRPLRGNFPVLPVLEQHLHKEVVNFRQLLFAVQGGEQLLAILLDGL